MKHRCIASLAIVAAGLLSPDVTQAAPRTYVAKLQATVADALGIGTATIVLDPEANTLRIVVSFSGLTGPATSAHVHCCVSTFMTSAGVAVVPPTLPGFPYASDGSYDQVYDTGSTSTWAPGFLTTFGGGSVAGAEAALLAGLEWGKAYVDIHTAFAPGGEIKGVLAPAYEFFTVAPCRVVDTRLQPDGSQPQPLTADAPRPFVVVGGSCGVPTTAAVAVVNVTAAGSNAAGHLAAYATGQAGSSTSVLNFAAGAVRANNAALRIGADGSVTVVAVGATVHLVIDVVGYYAMPPT
jgi:hypothetical protein